MVGNTQPEIFRRRKSPFPSIFFLFLIRKICSLCMYYFVCLSVSYQFSCVFFHVMSDVLYCKSSVSLIFFLYICSTEKDANFVQVFERIGTYIKLPASFVILILRQYVQTSKDVQSKYCLIFPGLHAPYAWAHGRARNAQFEGFGTIHWFCATRSQTVAIKITALSNSILLAYRALSLLYSRTFQYLKFD